MTDGQPNGDDLDEDIQADLDDFSEAVRTLTSGDLARLTAFWNGIDPDARSRAHEHAREEIERSGRREVVRDIQDRLMTWSGGELVGRTGWGDRWLDPGVDPIQDGNQRVTALPALADTVLALTLQDRLEDADFDALFGPWSHAIGEADDAAPTEGGE